MPAFAGMGYPLVPGYESIGRVCEAGANTGARVGERVFGVATDTYDALGAVVETRDAGGLTEQALRNSLRACGAPLRRLAGEVQRQRGHVAVRRSRQRVAAAASTPSPNGQPCG